MSWSGGGGGVGESQVNERDVTSKAEGNILNVKLKLLLINQKTKPLVITKKKKKKGKKRICQ